MVRNRDISFSVRDEIETSGNYVSRPSLDRDVEVETTSLGVCVSIGALTLYDAEKENK